MVCNALTDHVRHRFIGITFVLKNRKTFDEPEGMPSYRKEVVGHPFETYVTDDVIFKKEMKMQNYDMPSNMTPYQYDGALRVKALSENQM